MKKPQESTAALFERCSFLDTFGITIYLNNEEVIWMLSEILICSAIILVGVASILHTLTIDALKRRIFALEDYINKIHPEF